MFWNHWYEITNRSGEMWAIHYHWVASVPSHRSHYSGTSHNIAQGKFPSTIHIHHRLSKFEEVLLESDEQKMEINSNKYSVCFVSNYIVFELKVKMHFFVLYFFTFLERQAFSSVKEKVEHRERNIAGGPKRVGNWFKRSLAHTSLNCN